MRELSFGEGGARPGVLDADAADRLNVGWIAPAAVVALVALIAGLLAAAEILKQYRE